MDNNEPQEATVIDLGQASVETKGNAIFEVDQSGGELRYATGIASD